MDEMTNEQIALYALGALTPPETKQMRQQCAQDAALRNEAEAYAAVVGELALETKAVAAPSGLREQLMARIAATPQEAPKPLKAEVAPFTMRFDEGAWQPLAPHVFCKILHQDPVNHLVTSLIKLEPGGYLPRHRHLGTEQTLIVSGDCIVNGETFYAGDFRMRERDTEDSEVTTQFGTTILLVAPERFEILDAAWAH
jgi:anti-sigma factor ChrR (cupin superfamily)